MGGQCTGKVKPNSERKLVLSKEGYYLFNPVWHPSVEWIYYLIMPSDPPESPWPQLTGSVWRINSDGTNARLLIEGHFSLLTLSHSGDKLAFVKGSYPQQNDENDNKIIIADTSGIIIDTIQTTGDQIISWIKFSRTDDKIYYSTQIAHDSVGYFRINIDGSGDELLFTRYGLYYYFDLFPNDSLYSQYRTVPALNPQNSNYVVFPDEINEVDLILKNLRTVETDSLIAAPYGTPVYIDLPCWSPDGDKVIYCVGPERGSTLSIWKLELWMVEGIELK
jgi:dipeptidyl aminopeptidase/acylaminoacyl peptidase